MILLSTLIALSSTAIAQDCGPVPSALTDLNNVVSAFFIGSGEVSTYCPDDLSGEVDLKVADSMASQMSQTGRDAAAAQLAQQAILLGGDNLQAIANTAALLDALLGATLAETENITNILAQLHAIAASTDDQGLQRQIALNLWRRGMEDTTSKALVAQFLPTEPDYDRIFSQGNEVAITLRTGSDGFKHSAFESVFRRAGARIDVITPNEHLRVTYEVRPDDWSLPTVTYTIDIIEGAADEHFNDMPKDDMAVSMFGDHSNLGTSLDEALSNRPKSGQASTDFYWVDACKSKVFASRLSQAYPQGHFVYTKESELFRDMPKSFERGLVAMANHYDYDEMRRLVAAGSAIKGSNYIFPDDPAKLGFQDQDGDGITDSEDRIYNFGDTAGEAATNGELATRAVVIANTYMGYSEVFNPSTLDSSPVEDQYHPNGIFDGELGGPVTEITVQQDAYGNNKYFVAVSDEALDMELSQRTASIAAEMTQHQTEVLGWPPEYQAATSFLMGTAVYDVWRGDGWNNYNASYLPGTQMSGYQATQFIDDHDLVTRERVEAFIGAMSNQRQ